MAKMTIAQLAKKKAKLESDLAKVNEEINSRHGESDDEQEVTEEEK